MPNERLYEVLFLDQSQNHSNPLPTPNDINGSEVLVHESTGSRLAKVQQRFLIKYGYHVDPIEGHNMLFVAKSTTVPVPQVCAIYQSPDQQGVVTYIVMQSIPGTTLLESWGSLDKARKTDIAITLRTYFDQLRKLEPPGYFGDITGGPPLGDMFLATQDADDNRKSSLRTEDELIDYIIRAYSFETGERMAHKARYYQHVLPSVLRGNGSPVFTHNDFQRKNVIVQPDGTPVIIDWEFASWLPIYWEFSTAIYCNGGWNDDWHEYIGMVLDEYPTQSLWLSTMRNEMWC